MLDRLSGVANISTIIMHAQRIHSFRKKIALDSISNRNPDRKRQTEFLMDNLAYQDLLVEFCIAAAAKTVIACAWGQGWNARPMNSHDINLATGAIEILDQIEDVARQVDLQAQVTGSISLREFDIRKQFLTFEGGQELEAFKRKARKSYPDLDIEYSVLDECDDVFYMIELGRYYASDSGFK